MPRTSLFTTSPRRQRVAGALAATVLVGGYAFSSSSAQTIATTAGDNGVSSKTPTQVVDAAQAALHAAKSFVMTGTANQGSKKLGLKVIEAGTKKLQMSINESGETATIIVLTGSGYIKANKAFWTAQKVSKPATYANKWIELPANSGKALTSGLGLFTPSTLSRCIGEDLGTLSKAGSTTVSGQKAVVIHDAGDKPGSGPGNLAVATSGPAYPLRITTTGPTRAGGKIDVCNDGKAGDTEGTITLSDFNHAPAVKAPIKATTKLGTTPSS